MPLDVGSHINVQAERRAISRVRSSLLLALYVMGSRDFGPETEGRGEALRTMPGHPGTVAEPAMVLL